MVGSQGSPEKPNLIQEAHFSERCLLPSKMVRSIRLGAAQLNFQVGAISANVQRIKNAITQAESVGVDLLVFPELCLTGYPPEDLLLKPGFVDENISAMEELAKVPTDMALVVGFVDRDDDLYNAAGLIWGGELIATYRKEVLPNYGVFDEARYFRAGEEPVRIVNLRGVSVGVTICEDIWSPNGPIVDFASIGVDLIVNVNASPFSQGKQLSRLSMLATRAADNSVAVLYVNLVGGQDELVFDGSSLLFNHFGELVGTAGRFREELAVFDLQVPERFRKRLLDPRGSSFETDRDGEIIEIAQSQTSSRRGETGANPLELVVRELELRGPLAAEGEHGYLSSAGSRAALGYFDAAESYRALVLGTRDYVEKNGFDSALVALSGGVDSALVLAIACDAVGAERLRAIGLPSRYSSQSSIVDAQVLCDNLEVHFEAYSIEEVFDSYLGMVKPALGEVALGLTEENLQSRIRGTFMMALSNHSGSLVLTTGNKSELATGYSTLYGDTAGGFAVIKDVPKTHVYELCSYRNQLAGFDLIPRTILTKAPSAELRPDQRDDQSLPPYDVLDAVLYQLVELDMSPEEIASGGGDLSEIERIARLVDNAEYKRRQGPPGVKLTNRAFGKDRRMPITNGYRRDA